MEIAARWAVLGGATAVAAGAALGMAWAFLSLALRLMQPAGRTLGGLRRDTRLLARGYAKR